MGELLLVQAEALMRVSDLIRAGHVVIWDCEVCQRAGPVDLIAIERAKGGDWSLANRRPCCRQPGCIGRVRFKRMNGLWAFPMDTIKDGSAEAFAYHDGERERLEAAGWRIRSGKWQAP